MTKPWLSRDSHRFVGAGAGECARHATLLPALVRGRAPADAVGARLAELR